MKEDKSRKKPRKNTTRDMEISARMLLDNITDGIYVLDEKGYFVFVNSVIEKRSKMSFNQMVGKHFLEVVDPKYHDLTSRNFKKAMQGETVSPYELEYTNSKGLIIVVEVNSKPIYQRGRIIGLQGISRDITDRRRTEEKLRLLSSAVEQSSEGIAVLDLEGNLIYLNEAFAEMHGYSIEELTGKHHSILHAPEQMPVVEAAILQLRKKGFFKGEIWHVRRNGRVFPAHRHNALMTDESGKPIGMIGTVRDISEPKESEKKLQQAKGELELRVAERTASLRKTNKSLQAQVRERKQAEKALRESEERYRLLLETMNEGFGIQDSNGYLTYVNDKYSDILGLPKADIVGHSSYEFLDEENRRIYMEQLAKRRKGEHEPYEISFSRADGRKVHILMAPQPIFTVDGEFKGSFAVLTDITDLKNTEEKLDIKTANLEEINTALKVLLKKRGEDQRVLEEKVLINVKEMVLPFLEKLKQSNLNQRQSAYASILTSHLEDIISPFSRILFQQYGNLTPAEIQVANLVRQGIKTKEIAGLLSLSQKTIETHRKNLRKKLGMASRKENLRTHLLSMQ